LFIGNNNNFKTVKLNIVKYSLYYRIGYDAECLNHQTQYLSIICLLGE